MAATIDYRVKSGDSLSKIARDVLGNLSRWPEIAALNNIASPYRIFPNQILKVPAPWGNAAPVVVPPPPITTMPVPPGVPGMPGAPGGFADIWEQYRWPIIGGLAMMAFMFMPKKKRKRRRRR